MKFLRWLLETIVLDPLIFLFVWNVIITPMFNTGRTTFTTCLIISVISNFLFGCYLLNKD